MNWWSLFSYALVSFITPGPNNVLSLSNASQMGLRRALPFNFGVLLGFSTVSLLCALLCSVIAELLPKIQPVMIMLGAVYMIYLAWKILHSSTTIESRRGPCGFTAGVTMQFLNPKCFIGCIIAMQSYVLPFYQGQPLKVSLIALGLGFLGFLCTLCWALSGALFKRIFSEYGRITNTVMALLLCYCALALFR